MKNIELRERKVSQTSTKGRIRSVEEETRRLIHTENGGRNKEAHTHIEWRKKQGGSYTHRMEEETRRLIHTENGGRNKEAHTHIEWRKKQGGSYTQRMEEETRRLIHT